MRKIAVLPSLVTAGNIVCGFAAITALLNPERPVAFFQNGIVAGAWLIMLGMVFDMLDGKLARMAKVTSDFGGQLDSLSDCVTFGLAPSVLILSVATINRHLVWLLAALYVVCAAMRLARFNVEHSAKPHGHDYFKGLPSPAAAGLIASMVIFDKHMETSVIHTGVILPFAGLVAGLLMVSRVRYPHLLRWVLKGEKQFADLVRIIVVCGFIAWKPQFAFLVFFSSYAVSGIVQTTRMLVSARTRRRHTTPEASPVKSPLP